VNAILRSAFYSAVAADFDNDMDIDIFIDAGNPTQGDFANLILWNNDDGTFVPEDGAAGAVGTLTGTPDMVTIADYDVDGNEDILLTSKSGVQLYHNEGPHNHWLELDLRGRTSNADAIGAKVFVTAGGHTQLREQNGGVHFRWGQNDQRLHFGLGSHQTVNKLVIEWPSGAETVRQNISADQVLKITEP
jgi:ASPIC and UnbV